ncbi:Elongation of fatty acids protein 2 [Balamuthia mandrillaris]
MDEFIDFCILCGCDYCDTIQGKFLYSWFKSTTNATASPFLPSSLAGLSQGIGPKKALQLIRQYRTIEVVLSTLNLTKQPIPENFNCGAARELFKHPQVTNPDDLNLQWTEPDEKGLLQFLVEEKGFNEDRVRKGIAKLNGANKGRAVQRTLDTYFSATQKKKTTKATPTAPAPSPFSLLP